MYNSHACIHHRETICHAAANKFGVFIYDHKSSHPIGNGLKTSMRFVAISAVSITNKNSDVYRFISFSIVIFLLKNHEKRENISLYENHINQAIIIKNVKRL